MASLGAACQSDDNGEADTDSSPSSEPLDYIALGDSYTAAPLVPVTDTSDSCLRSTGNYPHLLAAELPDARLVDVSCSGADTRDLTGGQAKGDQAQPPQLDAVSAETDLVTIGMGANDFSLFAKLAVGCLQLQEIDLRGAPCRRSNEAGPGVDQLLDLIPRIQQRLTRAIDEIQERAPEATIVVVDYPRILPAAGTCPDLLPLADGDYRYVGEVNDTLSAAVRAAAHDSDVASVNVYAASRGHDVCSGEPWVAGIETVPGEALSLHPYAREQRAVAELILDEL